nr:F-box protein At5g67140 [Tanacetum cinerariifolium]
MEKEEAMIDQLPMDLLAHIFVFITCFKDLAQTSGVCKKWKEGVKQSIGRRERLSF